MERCMQVRENGLAFVFCDHKAFHPGAFSRRNGRKSVTAPPKRAMR